jgi:DNA polymerase-1
VSRILLIDGDVLAYAGASHAEKAFEWEPGEWTTHASMEDAQANITDKLEQYQRNLGDALIKIAMTDSVNFRKEVLPTYKANRANVRKPLILSQVRQWMFDVLQAVKVPTLEGDDVMGIWATHTGLKGEKIIVSIDKDMQSIPGLVYRPGKDKEPREISQAEADRWHLLQTMAGDATDGYSGCPGTGMVGAEKVIDNPTRLIKTETKKGIAWKEGDPCDVWQAILDRYAKAGLGPDEALRQARVARILRASDYDSKQKKVILWNPTVTQ